MKLLFLILILAPLFAKAQNSADCLPQEQEDFLFNNYKIHGWDAAKNDFAPIHDIPDLCDSTSLTHRLAKAVNFMNELNAYQDPSSSSIVTREGAGNYFKKRIASIEIEPTDEYNCAPGVIAYVYQIEKDVMHICSDGMANFESAMMMSYVLIHEARHTDGFHHVPCTHGANRKSDKSQSGGDSCDTSYEQQGSYGVAAGFMAEIAKFSTDPVQKQQARSTYVVDLVQRFNKLPLDVKPGLIAQTNEGEISFFDGAEKFPLLQLGNPKAVLTMRSDLPTFFDPLGSVKSFVFAQDLIDTKGGYAKDYVVAYSQSERESLKDVYYGSLHDYSCLLFADKLRCGDNFADDEDIDFQLKDIRPIQFLISENSALVNNEVLYIVADNGHLYPLPAKWQDFKAWSKNGSLTPSSQPYNLLSLVSIDKTNQEFAVEFSGRLIKLSPKTKSWSPVKEFKNDRFQKLTAPFFWSKKLEEI